MNPSSKEIKKLMNLGTDDLLDQEAERRGDIPKSFRIELPLKTVSEMNVREHWRVRSERAGEQRTLAYAKLVVDSGFDNYLPATVTITRVGKRMLDSDNLAGSQKHVRDGIADAFGVDDGDPRYTWKYEQKIGKEYGVIVEISR